MKKNMFLTMPCFGVKYFFCLDFSNKRKISEALFVRQLKPMLNVN